MAAAAAADEVMPYRRLDADTWQSQLEELLALQSVYDEDFRVLAAPGVGVPPNNSTAAAAAAGEGGVGGHRQRQQHQQPPTGGGGGGGDAGRCLDPEELLAAGPPPELLLLAADDGGGPSGSGGGADGGGPSMGCFVAEALVHVDVPEGGLQLILEVPPPPSPTAPSPTAAAAPPAPPASSASAAATAGGARETAHNVADGGGPSGRGKLSDRPRGGGGQGRQRGAADAGAEEWVAVTTKRGGGRGEGLRGRVSPTGGRSVGRHGAKGLGGRGGGGAGSGAAAEAGVAAPDGAGGPGPQSPPGGGGGGGGRGGRHSAATRGRGRVGPGRSAPQGESERGAAAAAPASASAGGGGAGVAAEGTDESATATDGPAGSPPLQGAAPGAAGAAPTAAMAPGPTAAAAAAPPAPTLVPFGASVQFLSPLRVTLTLPAAYPAAAPPAVELRALWLTPEQAAALVSELQEQWRAAGGGGVPILFLWFDWLRSEALPFLGVRQQLVLSGRGGSTVAAAAPPEGLALSLMRYSARREQDKFNESNVSCSICLEEQLGARCVRLPECRDAFCAACLSTHLRTQLAAGAVDNMRCPAPNCRRQLPPYVLQQLMTQAEYERWEALTLQRTLDKMEDLVYCPRCREPCLEDRDHCTLCPGCFFSFCSLCEDAWHPGSTCLDPEARLALLEERRAVAAAGRGASATERARQEINRRNELKSLALLQSTTKQCPMCSMGVEKTEGCNKMTCAYCGAYFCWRCNKVITGYDHFQQPRDGEGEGGCVLFEQQEIDRWNARWQAGGRAAEVEQQAAFIGIMRQHDLEVRLCNCVVCGQRNIKEGGNNDIRCWSCNSHFCYLCRTWLRTKPGAHFGPGRCRQHSGD